MIEHYKQCFKHKLNHEGICPKCQGELIMEGFKTMNQVMHEEVREFKKPMLSDDQILESVAQFFQAHPDYDKLKPLLINLAYDIAKKASN